MTHGIAFLQRFVDAAFSTKFNENGGIIKNILCFEQTESKQALLKLSGENAARKSYNSALSKGNIQPLNPERTPKNRLLSAHQRSRDKAVKNSTEARMKREKMNFEKCCFSDRK